MNKMNKQNNSYGIILEYVWLVIALFSLSFGIFQIFRIGLKQSYPLLLILIIALSMFFLRRYLRKTKKNY